MKLQSAFLVILHVVCVAWFQFSLGSGVYSVNECVDQALTDDDDSFIPLTCSEDSIVSWDSREEDLDDSLVLSSDRDESEEDGLVGEYNNENYEEEDDDDEDDEDEDDEIDKSDENQTDSKEDNDITNGQSDSDEMSDTDTAESSSAEKCTICLDYIDPDSDYRVLPCKHTFHRPCIRRWLRARRVCPNCLQAVPKRGHRRHRYVPVNQYNYLSGWDFWINDW